MSPSGPVNSDQSAEAKAQPDSKPGNVVAGCTSCACNVTVAPAELKFCNTKSKKELSATGTPSGGTYSWRVVDSTIAQVSGSGAKVRVQGLKSGQTKIEVTYKVDGCEATAEAKMRICACTHTERKYAYARKAQTSLIGVRAKIKTRYGLVCCETEACNTATGYNVVYANVSNETGKTSWAQSGFGRERTEGSKNAESYRYAEMNGNTYKVMYDKKNAPAEGSVHQYQCKLDDKTGTWHYAQDGVEWQKFSDTKWKGAAGTVALYTGEIFNQEDDMAGTAGNKCEITECQYLKKPAPVAPSTAPDEVLENFGFDEAGVTAEHEAKLNALAEQIAQSRGTSDEVIGVRIVGHTDVVGSAGYNQGLGQRRALAAKQALVKALDAQTAGLSSSITISNESKGESQPVDKTGTEEGNARNRRAELFLIFKAPPDDWQDAGLVEADVVSDDSSEWGAEWVSGTALNIWDVIPLT